MPQRQPHHDRLSDVGVRERLAEHVFRWSRLGSRWTAPGGDIVDEAPDWLGHAFPELVRQMQRMHPDVIEHFAEALAVRLTETSPRLGHVEDAASSAYGLSLADALFALVLGGHRPVAEAALLAVYRAEAEGLPIGPAPVRACHTCGEVYDSWDDFERETCGRIEHEDDERRGEPCGGLLYPV